jgi:hypothetical protein
MTREEAISIMSVIVHMLEPQYDTDRIEDAVEMAIKALETASCIKEKCAYCPHCENCDVDDETLEIRALDQEPCDDCIKREDALMCLTGEWTEPTDELIHRFIRRIRKLPPVTPAEKIGRWEWVQYDGNPNIGNWHCSECRCIFIEGTIKKEKDSIPFYKYCPQCGAKMKEGD